jgi:hypothetical protein
MLLNFSKCCYTNAQTNVFTTSQKLGPKFQIQCCYTISQTNVVTNKQKIVTQIHKPMLLQIFKMLSHNSQTMFLQIIQIYFHKFTGQCFYYFTKFTNYRNIVTQVHKPMLLLEILTFVFISDACTLTHVKVTKPKQNKTKHWKTLTHVKVTKPKQNIETRKSSSRLEICFLPSLTLFQFTQTETKLFIQTEKEGGRVG